MARLQEVDIADMQVLVAREIAAFAGSPSSTGWVYDTVASRYRNLHSGEFITSAAMIQLRDDFVGSRGAAVELLAKQLTAGSISLGEWQAAMEAEIKIAIAVEYAFGVGGILSMSEDDWTALDELNKLNRRFLDRFARQLYEGKVSYPQLLQRASMYVDAGIQAFERGQAAANDLELPVYPGEDCEGLTNCRCFWQFEDQDDGSVDCTWIAVGDGATCDPCAEHAKDFDPLTLGGPSGADDSDQSDQAGQENFSNDPAAFALSVIERNAGVEHQAGFGWVTINGNHVFIADSTSEADAAVSRVLRTAGAHLDPYQDLKAWERGGAGSLALPSHNLVIDSTGEMYDFDLHSEAATALADGIPGLPSTKGTDYKLSALLKPTGLIRAETRAGEVSLEVAGPVTTDQLRALRHLDRASRSAQVPLYWDTPADSGEGFPQLLTALAAQNLSPAATHSADFGWVTINGEHILISDVKTGSYSVGITNGDFQAQKVGEKAKSFELQQALSRLRAQDVELTVGRGGWKNDSGQLFEENALHLTFKDGSPENVAREMAALGTRWDQEGALVQRYVRSGGEQQAHIDMGRRLSGAEVSAVADNLKDSFGGWTFAVDPGSGSTKLVISNVKAWGGPPPAEFRAQIHTVADTLKQEGLSTRVAWRQTENIPLNNLNKATLSSDERLGRGDSAGSGVAERSEVQAAGAGGVRVDAGAGFGRVHGDVPEGLEAGILARLNEAEQLRQAVEHSAEFGWVTINGAHVLIGEDGAVQGGAGGHLGGSPPRPGDKLGSTSARETLLSGTHAISQQETLLARSTDGAVKVDLSGAEPTETLPLMRTLAQVTDDYPLQSIPLTRVVLQGNQGDPFHGADWASPSIAEVRNVPRDWVKNGEGEWVREGGRVIGLNPELFSALHPGQFNDKPLSSLQATDRGIGWTPKVATDTGFYAAHEYGHIVRDDLERVAPKETAAYLDGLVSVDHEAVSGYARFGADEAFAENFAAYYYGSRHPDAKAMGALLKSAYGVAPRLNKRATHSAEDAEFGWVTINGAHVLIGEDGEVQSGAGGKLGKAATAAPKGGAGGKADAKEALRLLSATPDNDRQSKQERVAQIEDQLARALPGTEQGNFHPIVDLGSIQPEIARPVAVALATVAQDYPEASRGITYVGSYDGDKSPMMSPAAAVLGGTPDAAFPLDAVAATNTSTGVIGFNPDKWYPNALTGGSSVDVAISNRDDWFPPEAQSVGSGFIALHEFGHVVHQDILDNHPKALPTSGDPSGPSYQDVFTGLPQVSTYAISSDREYFAETFAAYYAGSTAPAAKAMGRVLTDAYGTAPQAPASLRTAGAESIKAVKAAVAAAAPPFKFAADEGNWVTINGQHVLIGKGGEILKGGSHLGIDKLGGPTDWKARRAEAESKHAQAMTKTLLEQETHLQAALTAPRANVNLAGLLPAETAPIVNTLVQLTQDYPAPGKAVAFVGSDASHPTGMPYSFDMKGGQIAETIKGVHGNPDLNAIGLSSFLFGQDSQYSPNGLARGNAESGTIAAVASDSGYFAAHEFGHVVWNQNPGAATTFMATQGPKAAASVSLYARQNSHEGFAEMFGAYYYGSTTAPAVAMGEFLKAQYGSAPQLKAKHSVGFGWVTINGQHVLIGEDGSILAGGHYLGPKATGSPPLRGTASADKPHHAPANPHAYIGKGFDLTPGHTTLLKNQPKLAANATEHGGPAGVQAALNWSVEPNKSPDNVVTEHAAYAAFGVGRTTHIDTSAKPDAARVAVLKMAYAATQRDLVAQHISALTVYRGLSYSAERLPANLAAIKPGTSATVQLDTAPLSSFSVHEAGALKYTSLFGEQGGGQFVISTTVPAKAVFSTPQQGWGSPGSHEVVVLGGQRSYVATRIAAPVAAPSPSAGFARASVPDIDEESHNADWIRILDGVSKASAAMSGPPYDYASTQVNLSEDAVAAIKRWQKQIPKSDLAAGGLEKQSHVTVLFGLLPSIKTADIARVLEGQKPVVVKFGKTGSFPEGKDGVPLFVQVESTDLGKLNKLLAESLPNKQTHASYKPHVTIAYLKPEAVERYADQAGPLNGQSATFDTVMHSTIEGKQQPVQLGGEAKFGWVTIHGNHVLIGDDEGGSGAGGKDGKGKGGRVGPSSPTLASLKVHPTAQYVVDATAALEHAVQSEARKAGMTAEAYKAAATEHIKDFMDGAELKMRVSEDVFASMLKYHETEFKNQIETGNSMGLLNPTLRMNVENEAFGSPTVETLVAAEKAGGLERDYNLAGVHPKYAYMENIPKAGVNQTVEMFGGVEVTFKPAVLEHTTITMSDSLKGMEDRRVLPSPARSPDWRSAVDLAALQTAARTTNLSDFQSQLMYVEAQIHGPLRVSDIASISLPHVYNPDPILAAAKEAGITVTDPQAYRSRPPVGTVATTIGDPVPAGRTSFADGVRTVVAQRGPGVFLLVQDEAHAWLYNEQMDKLSKPAHVQSFLKFGYWGKLAADVDQADILKRALRLGFADGDGHWVTIGGNPVMVGGAAPSGTTGYEGSHAKDTVPNKPADQRFGSIQPPSEGVLSVALDEARNLADALDDLGSAPSDYKAIVAGDLADRLHGNAAFDAMAAKRSMLTPSELKNPDLVTEARISQASSLVHQWAVSSSDDQVPSIALQHAVQDEFGLSEAATIQPGSEAWVAAASATEYGTNGPGYRAFARAVYDNTQAELARDGIHSMLLYRGMSFSSHVDAENAGMPLDGMPHTLTVTQQPASSWAYDFSTARGFAAGDAAHVMAAVVPASRIYSTMKTGIGAKDEHEVVVLGGPARVNVLNVAAFADHYAATYGGAFPVEETVQRVLLDPSQEALSPPPSLRLERLNQIQDSLAAGHAGQVDFSGRRDVNIDADLRNADWLKTRTWDVRTKNGAPVTTLEQLRSVFPSWETRDFKHLLTIPSGEAMPKSLRQEIAQANFAEEGEGHWVTIDGHPVMIGGGYSAAITSAARGVRAHAERQEASVTPMLQKLATDQGGKLAGLEFRLKGQPGLERKIHDRAELLGISPAEAAESIGDSLRYTIVSPAADLVTDAKGAIATLERSGYQVSTDNYWVKGDTFNGIISDVSSPAGRFELQFHTAESMAMKMKTHPDYAIMRDDNQPVAARLAAFKRMVPMADSLHRPPDVMSVGTPRLQVFQP